MNKHLLSIAIFLWIAGIPVSSALGNENIEDGDISLLNMTSQELIKTLGEEQLYTFREEGDDRWMTFIFYDEKEPYFQTLHLVKGRVINGEMNDREEIAKEYLGEFASGNILSYYVNIRKALLDVFEKLPHDIFLSVTPRSRPTLFIDVNTSGIARYANALEFSTRPDDPPTFQDGFYLIKLGDELDKINDIDAIEGVIFHELAHRVLNHLHADNVDSCDMEKEANRLVKQWGFEKEFLKAKKHFGSKEKGDSPCSDKVH